MSADGEVQSEGGGSESEEVAGGELRGESRILYSRDYLLSLAADLEVCKKLPGGIEESVLSELDECCRKTSAPSSAASRCCQTNHLLSRSSQPYRPPSFHKAANHPWKESIDSINEDTFGSTGIPGSERLLEERRRKASFDSTRKWQKKVVQGNGQSLDDQKENFDSDTNALVNHSHDGTEFTSGSVTVPSYTSAMQEDKLGSQPLTHSLEPGVHIHCTTVSKNSEYETAATLGSDGQNGKDGQGGSVSQQYLKEIDAINAIKREDTRVPTSNVEISGDSSGFTGAAPQVSKLLESCVDQADGSFPWKFPMYTSSHMSGQDQSIPRLLWNATAISEICNMPFQPHDINEDDRRASKSSTSKFAHLFAGGDKVVADTFLSYGGNAGNEVYGASSDVLFKHDLQDLITPKLLLLTSAASAETVSVPCYVSSRPTVTPINPTYEGQQCTVQGSKTYQDAEQQICSINVNASKHLLTMLQTMERMNDLGTSQEMIRFPDQAYNVNGAIPYTGLVSSKSDSSERPSSQRSEHGRNFMRELHPWEASVSSLKMSRGNLKKAGATEVCKYHHTQFNQGHHKTQLPHLRNPLSQAVTPPKLKIGLQVMEDLKFKPLCGFSEKADSIVEIELPVEESLITVDDTLIYQPPTPMPSSNPRNKLMGHDFDPSFSSQQQDSWYGQSHVHAANDAVHFKGMAHQNPASNPQLPAPAIVFHPLQQTISETRLKRQLPDISTQRMQQNGYLPPYLPDGPATDTAVYGSMHQIPCDIDVPSFMQSFPLGYQQNLNPNMNVAIPGGGNLVGFDRISEMEMRLKQLMNHEGRARCQRDFNQKTVDKFYLEK